MTMPSPTNRRPAHVARHQARADGRRRRGAALFLHARHRCAAAWARWPYLWFLGNPVLSRGPAVTAPSTQGHRRPARTPARPRQPRASAAASAARPASTARRVELTHAAAKPRRRVPAGRASSSSWASTTTCMDGKAYWTEQACYAFTVRRDRPAGSGDRGAARPLPQGGRARRRQQAVGAHAHPAGLGRLHRAACGGAPTRRSVGRFDLAYDGGARRSCWNTTPTRRRPARGGSDPVVLAAGLEPDVDQFNSIHERLIEAWKRVKPTERSYRPLHGTARAPEGRLHDHRLSPRYRDAGGPGHRVSRCRS